MVAIAEDTPTTQEQTTARRSRGRPAANEVAQPNPALKYLRGDWLVSYEETTDGDRADFVSLQRSREDAEALAIDLLQRPSVNRLSVRIGRGTQVQLSDTLKS